MCLLQETLAMLLSMRPLAFSVLLPCLARMSRPSGSARLGAGADLIGESLACQRVRQLIERMAPTDRPLLIRGPTGAGKEVVARRVHRLGIQPEAPFVDVNCAAIPENLVESELFGHARGAFTGASNYRAGFSSRWGRARCFWMKSANCRWRCNPSCCACWKPVSSAR